MQKYTLYRSAEGKKKILDDYETYLQTFHVHFERVYVDTRFGKTHTLIAGPTNGKPVFILQGGNCINPMTLSWFSSLFEEYRIYAPDTIGHPGYSEETRISAQDDSFAFWISDLMDQLGVEKSAFIGPSYGAGIILRLATFMPKKISCSILVSPSGIQLGSKIKLMKSILLPLLLFNLNSSQKHLDNISQVMSFNSMKELDKNIIGHVFQYVKLEQNMPKLTEKDELSNYSAPTMVITGKKDIFFPTEKVSTKAKEIFSHLITYHNLSYEMGHFPSEEFLQKINSDIKDFLRQYY